MTTETAATTPAAEPDLYPMRRNRPLDPPDELARRRVEDPVSRVRIWSGDSAWLVTRLDDAKAAFADERMSVDARRPGFPAFTESSAYASSQARRTFLDMDEPDHGRIRRMFLSHFSVKRVEQLRPMVRQLVTELLDDMEEAPQPVDLVRNFSLPLTSKVICLVMGVPYDLAEEFQAFAELSMKPETTLEEYAEATERIHVDFRRYIQDCREKPNDGLLSQLVNQHLDAGELTEDELLAQLDLVFVAGHDTTANQISLGTLALLAQPDQAALLRESEDPAFLRNAIDDLVRFISIAHYGMRRIAADDLDIGDQHVRAGEAVIISLDTANRDEALVAHPEKLDFERRMSGHVGFGFGVHQCLGQNLARVELTEAYPAILRRFPDLRLATPLEELKFHEEYVVYGVEAVPLTWGKR